MSDRFRVTRFLAAGACAGLLAACTTTQQAAVVQSDIKCGFLGPACAQLTPGQEGQLALRYVDPAAKWSQYTRIMIQPVTFWGDANSKVSPEDQQRLVNFLYTALDQELAKQFQVVDPAAKWSQYTRIMIQPVTFWGDANSKVSPENVT